MFPTDSNVMVGLERADDAGVYRISEDLAIIQTVDFFTPVVDDPFEFGQIAAANALSDVYAMGGTPKTAMNLVGFPVGSLDIGVLRQIILGGLDKVKEAGCVLLGGHSVEDPELKYGLSVTGFIHPDRVLTKGGLSVGDRLFLTKPLGTGVINTAVKAGLASEAATAAATRIMATLNASAAKAMACCRVHACTDITGFGLLGHLAEMVDGSGCSAAIHADCVPLMAEARSHAEMGLVPAGAYRNRDFREEMVEMAPAVSRSTADLLYDPQTSGGLLICVSEKESGMLREALEKEGVEGAAEIGTVLPGPVEKIMVS